MRKLKFHEQKLLKKTNFYDWKSDSNLREGDIVRRYNLTDREDYGRYNKICGLITKLTAQLRKLKPDDEDRQKMTQLLLEKLFSMGVIHSKQSLELCEKIPVSRFCRRRLSVLVVEAKMAESPRQATEMIEQGHIRIGPEAATNPALHVTRDMQDHVTWSEGSKVKRHVKAFRGEVDDYELLRN